MRKPASIHSWLLSEDLQTWVCEARGRDEYQRRLAICLTYPGPFPAPQVARLLGVSKQSVWLRASQYNRCGPKVSNGEAGEGGAQRTCPGRRR